MVVGARQSFLSSDKKSTHKTQSYINQASHLKQRSSEEISN